jgi:hypothetical protein
VIASRTVAPIVLCACTIHSSSSVVAASAPQLFEPAPDREESTGWIEDGGWIDEGPGYGVRLRLVDEAERLAYLERTTGQRIDPFATPPEREPRYVSFLLELSNSGDSPLYLQAQSAWLHAGQAEVLHPIGIEGLASAARAVDRTTPEAWEHARGAVLEHAITVSPGEKIAGLLVYRRFKPDVKRFRVEIQFTLPTGEMARFVAPYQRRKPDKSKKSAEPASSPAP